MHCDRRKRRQLQHGRVLTLAQLPSQDDLPIGKFQSVMMNVWLVFVDMLKLSEAMSELPANDHANIPLHLFLKGKFCSGKQAHGHVTILDRGKTTCRGVGKAR